MPLPSRLHRSCLASSHTGAAVLHRTRLYRTRLSRSHPASAILRRTPLSGTRLPCAAMPRASCANPTAAGRPRPGVLRDGRVMRQPSRALGRQRLDGLPPAPAIAAGASAALSARSPARAAQKFGQRLHLAALYAQLRAYMMM